MESPKIKYAKVSYSFHFTLSAELSDCILRCRNYLITITLYELNVRSIYTYRLQLFIIPTSTVDMISLFLIEDLLSKPFNTSTNKLVLELLKIYKTAILDKSRFDYTSRVQSSYRGYIRCKRFLICLKASRISLLR